MRISSIELVRVVVPTRPGRVNSEGMDRSLHKLAHGGEEPWQRQFDSFDKHILLARCDDGTVGIGESLRACRPEVLAEMAATLIRTDLRDLAWQRLPFARVREYEGFETLVLDLIGRRLGIPVHQLLGGAYRDRVRVGAWSGHRTPSDAAELAAEAVSEGLDCIKFKCELGDDVVGIAQAIRDRCGSRIEIIFDPNERFNELRHALAIARGLEAVGNVLCLEDPLPRWDLRSYARLRQATTVPVAVHVATGYAEHGQKVEDVALSFRDDAADVFNFSGCVADFVRMGHLADAMHRPYWHGSEVDLGILEATMVHAAAASLGCTLPSDIFGRRVREHDLLAAPLVMDGPHVLVPSGPGLGVELDHDALDRYATSRTTVEA